MRMHLAPGGKTLYLQERNIKPALSRGLLAYAVGAGAPAVMCSNSFQAEGHQPEFAYGFASFPDEPLLVIADQLRNLTLFDVTNPCSPKLLTKQHYEFDPDSMVGGPNRTLIAAFEGLKKYRVGDELSLQASLQTAPGLIRAHVNATTGLTLVALEKDVAVLRTTRTGAFAVSDRFRIVAEPAWGVVSTQSGHVYIGWKGGLGVGLVPLR